MGANNNCKRLFDFGPCVSNEYDEQVEIMNELLNRDDVYSIGVISPYGGGKSSFLKSFKNKYVQPKKSQFHNKTDTVSFGYLTGIRNSKLESSDNGDQNNKLTADDEVDIEKGILQQLLFSKKPKIFSSSNIKRVESNSVFSNLVSGLIFAICLVTSILCWTFFGTNLAGIDFLYASWSSYFFLGCGVFVSIATIAFGFALFKKMSIKYDKLELSYERGNDKESLLDKYVDELIYYFKKHKIRIVFFEDIDRFSDRFIFNKLKEINATINANGAIQKNKGVIFVYSVSEDIFKSSSDRTKFFDFIIHIQPILSPYNANVYLSQYLEENGFTKDLVSQAFIDFLSLYFSDMRTLKSTINDFFFFFKYGDKDITFKSQILITESKEVREKMALFEEAFCFCALRNLYPQFNQQLEKGETEFDEQIRTYEKSYCLAEAFDIVKKNIDSFFSNSDKDESIFFFTELIKSGYIDYRYKYFLASHINEEVPEEELAFLKNINFDGFQAFDQTFANITLILNRISINTFAKPEALNFDIVEALFDDNSKDPIDHRNQKEACLIALLSKGNEPRVIDFIKKYLSHFMDKNLTIDSFFKKMAPKRRDLISIIKDFSIDEKQQLLFSLIRNTNASLFATYENEDDACKVLCSSEHFLTQLDIYNWIISFAHKHSFDSLGTYQYSKETLLKLIDNRCFSLTYDNFSYLMEKLDFDSSKINRGQQWIRSKSPNIGAMIDADLSNYTINVLLECDSLNLNVTDANQIYDSKIRTELKKKVLMSNANKFKCPYTKMIGTSLILFAIAQGKSEISFSEYLPFFRNNNDMKVSFDDYALFLKSEQVSNMDKEVFFSNFYTDRCDKEICKMFLEQKVKNPHEKMRQLLISQNGNTKEDRKRLFLLCYPNITQLADCKESLQAVDEKYMELFTDKGMVVLVEELKIDFLLVELQKRFLITKGHKYKTKYYGLKAV